MPGIVVIADSREKEAYTFDPTRITTVRKALSAGDYAPLNLEKRVAVERKTVEDFVKTIILDRKRFDRELAKLETYDAACIVVEGSLQDVLDGNYRSGIHPNSVFGALMAIIIDRRIPIFFCGDRQAARTFTEGYLIRCHQKFSQAQPS